MEEMRGAAMAYYANMSIDQQQKLLSFYKSLDTNGDGKVSIQEYLDFLEQNGYSRRYMPPNFFKLLDENNDGTLDFEECVTLFYMINGRRLVICDGCASYLWGLHFLCVECYRVRSARNRSYDLCCSCYRNKNFIHAHSNFLDNYALLRTINIKFSSSVTIAELPTSTTNDVVPCEPQPSSSSVTIAERPTSTTNDVAPCEPQPQWEQLPHRAAEAVVQAIALKALDLVLDTASAYCTTETLDFFLITLSLFLLSLFLSILTNK